MICPAVDTDALCPIDWKKTHQSLVNFRPSDGRENHVVARIAIVSLCLLDVRKPGPATRTGLSFPPIPGPGSFPPPLTVTRVATRKVRAPHL